MPYRIATIGDLDEPIFVDPSLSEPDAPPAPAHASAPSYSPSQKVEPSTPASASPSWFPYLVAAGAAITAAALVVRFTRRR